MMYRIFVTFLTLTLWAAACSSPPTAEQPAASSGGEAEPAASSDRGTAELALGATQVSINYGRPQLQGRDMLSQLPDGQIWRLGMNDATTLETSSDLAFGDTVLQAGRYSIWAKKVTSDNWRLIFNSEPDVWGLSHNPAADVAETPLEYSELAESVEQFTIELNSVDDSSAEVLMQWSTLQIRAVLHVSP
ncbi:MAG: DUF2911 domain-containing protein [Acidobacteriota bacterium]